MVEEDIAEAMESADDVEMEEVNEEETEEGESNQQNETLVWTKDIRPLQEGEVLELSPGCYDMLHAISVDWPCLSFDIYGDELGACRVEYPHECYVIAGTQPDDQSLKDAAVHLMKWSNLSNNEGFDFTDDESDDEDACNLTSSSIKHPGIVNRIRCCPQSNRLVSTMADSGKVYVWDVHEQRTNLDDCITYHRMEKVDPIFTCSAHETEGYALGWSPVATGTLATGDCSGAVVLWSPIEADWEVEQFFKAEESIEDIQWSPRDDDVFITACCDGYVRVHDLRTPQKAVMSLLICDSDVTDVNSIAWNPNQTNLVVAGDEAGIVTVFDVRLCEKPMAQLFWHKEPITSVAWHPTDSAVCIASSRDDSMSIWDISVEKDASPHKEESGQHIPHQLLFLHMGQTEITEVMFHPQIPGVIISTSADGFNVFKCVNVD
ncbi:Glutamate-rich WD repeat-containing protein 1 [Babesia sp. Xinjiang]|uniref:Glutamate-rich WD repeat-containing protein 1 n=1 Tax=Babesia sp. Xinjiang TaxID=462227 RepID=UPI000A250F3B|nr:Glutamate-rich WD repeat-containing protein 1 [Babesia sp. Xinjiang]XP_028871412.1 Glutamate-rich WD repeat-containing protein 1 [Babesia sp. Xinjiang]ORM40919.1 Glutamate-rich WD repeat-containing protein 1 [Babesia sp. Xinjiang]ORM40956.1 Glutamate-rich WD repeat-containing protein 1 [Babesia sp. Xinjiang]